MRWLGAILLAVSVSSVGFLQTRILVLCRRELGRMRLFAQETAGKIRLGRMEAERLLCLLAEEEALRGWLFLSLFCESAGGGDFRAAFAHAAERYGQACPLPGEDLARLGAVGAALGSGDLEEELRRCACLEVALVRLIRVTVEAGRKKAPLYQTLWCCIGVLGGIFLL